MNLRESFPVADNWAFFDNARVGPITCQAQRRLREWEADAVRNGGVHVRQWMEEVEAVRADVACLLRASPEEIAFTKNTSEGISLVAEGFPWQDGDNVVLADCEYPSNIFPWVRLSTRGVQTVVVRSRGSRVLVDDLASAIDTRTRLLTLSFVQYSTGFRSDLEAVGQLCREQNVDLCVDGIQGLGVHPIDVDAMRIDYLAASSHKWLASPHGAGILYVNRSKLDKIRPTSVGWKSVAAPHEFSRTGFRLVDDARRFECGSFVIPSILALGGSLSLFQDVGADVVERLVKKVTDHLVERLKSIDAAVFSSRRSEDWSGIVSFVLPGRDPDRVVQCCLKHKVAISQRDGRIRASAHAYNNEDDVAKFIDSLSSSGGGGSF